MPLLDGCTEGDIQENIATLIDEGKEPEEAAAIAHSLCDGNKSLQYYFGGSVKAIGSGIIEGVLVPFTDVSTRDLHGEYFDSKTEFNRDDFPVKGIPVFYQHGFDDKMRVKVLGRVVKEDEDELGIWVRAQLDMRDEYERAIYEMVEDNKMGFSSGALPASVEVSNRSGHIKQWFIQECSITPTPAMPDKTRVHTAKSLQAALIERDAKEANADNDERAKNKPGIPATKRKLNENEGENDVATKALTKQDIEMIEEALAEVVVNIAEAAGLTVTEEEVADLTDEVEAVAVEIVEEELEDDMKQEGDEEEDEEEAKSAKKHAIQTLIQKSVAELVPPSLKRYIEEKEAQKQASKQAALNAVNGVRGGVAGSSVKRQRGGFTQRQNANPRITVEEQRKYAGAEWQDMALFVKLKSASINKLPNHLRNKATLGDIVSPEFARNMAHKMSIAIDKEPFSDPVDAIAVKMQAPWLKADEMDATDITSQGLEWVGTTFDADLWRRDRHELRLLDLLTGKQMRIKDVDPGTNKVTFAIDTGSGTVYTRGEPNSVDATGRPEATVQVQPFTTDNVTMTAKEHALAYVPSDWLVEDTFVDTMQHIRFDMLQLLEESLEGTLLNGDTETAASTNINKIDGTPGTGLQTPDYIAWNGMRKNYLVTNTGQQLDLEGGLAITDYMLLRAKFATTIRNRKMNMLTIIDFDTEVATRKLVQVLTADVAGGSQLATMYTGDLPQVLDGVDTYTSGLLGKTNADGKVSVTAGNNTQGQIVIAYAPYIAYGRKRQVEVKEQEDILSGSLVIVASIRHTSIHRSADGSVGAFNVGV